MLTIKFVIFLFARLFALEGVVGDVVQSDDRLVRVLHDQVLSILLLPVEREMQTRLRIAQENGACLRKRIYKTVSEILVSVFRTRQLIKRSLKNINMRIL